jgi:DNA invertase Pin-like site-specific DNA recombinase
VITTLDRFRRSVRNLKELADSFADRVIGRRALSRGIDAATPRCGLFFHAPAAIAEFEHELISNAG